MADPVAAQVLGVQLASAVRAFRDPGDAVKVQAQDKLDIEVDDKSGTRREQRGPGGRISGGESEARAQSVETGKAVEPAKAVPTVPRTTVIMQIIVTLVALAAGIYFLVNGTADIQKTAAGWIGIVIGYWLR